jgi:hypothetical protein
MTCHNRTRYARTELHATVEGRLLRLRDTEPTQTADGPADNDVTSTVAVVSAWDTRRN